jgi:hypothetical protein
MIIKIFIRFLIMICGAEFIKFTSPQNGNVHTYEKRIAVQIQNAGSFFRLIALGS